MSHGWLGWRAVSQRVMFMSSLIYCDYIVCLWFHDWQSLSHFGLHSIHWLETHCQVFQPCLMPPTWRRPLRPRICPRMLMVSPMKMWLWRRTKWNRSYLVSKPGCRLFGQLAMTMVSPLINQTYYQWLQTALASQADQRLHNLYDLAVSPGCDAGWRSVSMASLHHKVEMYVQDIDLYIVWWMLCGVDIGVNFRDKGVNFWDKGVNFRDKGVNFWDKGVNFWDKGVNFWDKGVNFWDKGVNFWDKGVNFRDKGQFLGQGCQFLEQGCHPQVFPKPFNIIIFVLLCRTNVGWAWTVRSWSTQKGALMSCSASSIWRATTVSVPSTPFSSTAS